MISPEKLSHIKQTILLDLIIKKTCLEWDTEKDKLEKHLEIVMGTKDRTVEGYAIIGMAVKYIYDNNKEVFENLGHPWEEMMEEFLPGRFRDAVRMSHPEISRPDLVLKNYLKDISKILTKLTISEVIYTWLI